MKNRDVGGFFSEGTAAPWIGHKGGSRGREEMLQADHNLLLTISFVMLDGVWGGRGVINGIELGERKVGECVSISYLFFNIKTHFNWK